MNVRSVVEIGCMMQEILEATSEEVSWSDLEKALFKAGLFPEQYPTNFVKDHPKCDEWLAEAINEVLEDNGYTNLYAVQDF